ncbi:MAG: glycoside hydrolase family 130 protein [Armatimonadota bacterium]
MTLSWRRKLSAERLNHGLPLISADPNGWDNGFTLNPTAVRLEISKRNDELIRNILGGYDLDDPKLSDGVVAVFYRGIPQEVVGRPSLRSSVGLAVFTPDMELIKRFAYPLVVPTDDPMGYDYNGVEDQRITRVGDTFYMLYCGYNPNLPIEHNIHICMAESTDLLNWTKLGPVCGSVNDIPNKDAVLLPEPVDGLYFMMHRPMVGAQSDYNVSLAVSDSPTGEWLDLGTILRAEPDPRYRCSWTGAGSAPIPLGDNRYLADFHTGNYYPGGERDYASGYAILDFNSFDIDRPESVVECRCQNMIEPETPYEVNSPWPHDKTLNCVFSSGSFIHGRDVILLYGGADAYVLGARFDKNQLVDFLETFGSTVNSKQASAVSA